MRRLTDEERMALRQIGPIDEGPVSDFTFNNLIELGYGNWEGEGDDCFWTVTASGVKALELDTIARGIK